MNVTGVVKLGDMLGYPKEDGQVRSGGLGLYLRVNKMAW
jgi:hypothetical protein